MTATTSVNPDGVVLSARNLLLQFGGIVALNDVSIDVRKDELLAIIGPNGAGKSTLIKVIAGVVRPDGSVTAGKDDWLSAPVLVQSDKLEPVTLILHRQP